MQPDRFSLDDLLVTQDATGATIHERDLAALLGITRQAIDGKVRSGVLKRVGRATFAYPQAIRDYCAHLREHAGRAGRPSASGSSKDLQAEKLRLTAAQADGQELKNRIASGELVAIADVRTEWVTVATDLRAQILAIPARVAARAGLSRDAAVLLEEEIRLALEELRDER